MGALDSFRGHGITVETLTGSGAFGDVYAAPVALGPATGDGVLVVDKRRMVLDAGANRVISESTVYDPETGHQALYAPGSRVTLADGRTARVITVSAYNDPGMGLPSSLEVALT